jgi:hypothetical protein
MMTGSITDLILARKLEDLLRETTSLMTLGHQLSVQIREVLEEVTAPPSGEALRRAGRAYLAAATNREIREVLLKTRGAKSTANLRTRLNGDLERRNGRRHGIGGHARVGNGVHG